MMISGYAGSLFAGLISFYSFRLILRIISPKPRKRTETEKYYLQANGKPILFPSLHSKNGKTSLSIIIPAYNEQDRLPIMLAECYAHLSSCGLTWEIILVDDGSWDATSKVAMDFASKHELGDQLRVLKLEKNRGKGGAVTQGMLVARGDRLLFVDADGATRFSDLDLLMKQMDESIIDDICVVIGSRAHMVDTDARSKIRNFLMHSLHLILYILGIRTIKDTQCGFKLISRLAAQRIFPHMHVEGWIFDIELLLLAQHQNIPIIEVPVNWHEVGGSKVQLVQDSMRMLKDLILLRACYIFGAWSFPKVVLGKQEFKKDR